MIKIKKLIASGAFAGALALGVIGAAGVAHADTRGTTFNLAPGTQGCVSSTTPAYYNVRADGRVNYGHNVRFTLSATGPAAFETLYDTWTPVTSWAREYNSYSQPWLFPSNFQACAINQSLKYSNVTLTLATN